MERKENVMKVLRGMGLAIVIVLFATSGVTHAQSSALESYDRGVEYATQGKFKDAKEEFEKALRVDSFYVPAKGSVKVIEDVIYHNIESKTAIHFFNAVACSNKGRCDQAIAEFTKAIVFTVGFMLRILVIILMSICAV